MSVAAAMDMRRRRERGWDVVPSFVGEGFLDRELLEELQSHPLVAGDSSWGARNLLHALILSTRPKIVVEIGAQIGAASLVIGSALKTNGFGKSYHLEPDEHYYPVLRDFITRARLDDYSYALQMLSTDPVVEAMFNRDVDLLFLDSSHSYSRAYHNLLICNSLLSANGVILVDDVAAHHSSAMCDERRGGVRQAVMDFVAGGDFSAVFLEPPFWLNPCGIAILSRKPLDQKPRHP